MAGRPQSYRKRTKGKVNISQISVPVQNARLDSRVGDAGEPALSPYFFPKAGEAGPMTDESGTGSDSVGLQVEQGAVDVAEDLGGFEVVEFGVAVGDDRLSMIPDPPINLNNSTSSFQYHPIPPIPSSPHTPRNKRSTLRLSALPAALHRIRHSAPGASPTPSSPIGPPSPLTAIHPGHDIPPDSPSFAFGGLMLSIPMAPPPVQHHDERLDPRGSPPEIAPRRPTWTTQPSNAGGTGLLRTLSARAALREMMGHDRLGSDWVLADALAATPTRFNLPVSKSDGHQPTLEVGTGLTGHHNLVPVSIESSVDGSRSAHVGGRARRKARNLRPSKTEVGTEAGPTTAPPRQTEWLGPVRPSLLEPRFSSTRVLEDVFRAAEVGRWRALAVVIASLPAHNFTFCVSTATRQRYQLALA